MIHPLPCPFCGHVGIDAVETSTFRWVVAECGSCGARGPESRRDPLPDLVIWGYEHYEALEE